jgi:hypothetical protein
MTLKANKHRKIFIATLFTVAKIGNNPNFHRKINKENLAYNTVEYSSLKN